MKTHYNYKIFREMTLEIEELKENQQNEILTLKNKYNTYLTKKLTLENKKYFLTKQEKELESIKFSHIQQNIEMKKRHHMITYKIKME